MLVKPLRVLVADDSPTVRTRIVEHTFPTSAIPPFLKEVCHAP